MDTKACSIRNIEKHINNFYIKYSESRGCNRARGLKRYYENKEKISNQQKIYYEKIEIKFYCKNKTIEVNNLEV